MLEDNIPKIRWSPRLRPQRLKRLYESDAQGIQDIELCDNVALTLFMRCRTFVLVSQWQVECPVCRTVFAVATEGESRCPGEGCNWSTTQAAYARSIRNHYAFPGRAMEAFQAFYEGYPQARTYGHKITLIDQLIHSFHVVEETGTPTKSVASKLFEGNKKAVVRFLNDLSARNPESKEEWRHTVAGTIDRNIVQPVPPEEG
jgi:hypothetical protein